MKMVCLLTAILLLPALLCAQTEKGAVPLNLQSVLRTPHSTRAVVVGISDYQDPAIPDLQYAHRDAEAFAEWLRSSAGGSVPEQNIQKLLNQNATMGKVSMALWALMTECREGDQAIIYFSGHGDVETRMNSQPGYWLCSDAPSFAYMSGGCINVRDLKDIVSTLSLQNKVRVLLISDACHAGKLAGSEVGGTQAVAQNMAGQFANEVKILSCQPNEFALEGVQWGGGRGCFSYHLTNGLYGLAERNSDGRLTLLEIENYLEERVPAEAAPHPQLPFVVGNKTAEIARVDAPTLARIRAGLDTGTPDMEKIEPRGTEAWVLAQADSSILEMYAAFNAALERKELLAPAGTSADDYFRRLIVEPSLQPLHGLMTRNFAAALLDESQQVTNKMLKTDPQIVSDALSRPFIFDHIPRYISRAIELLGEKHFLYRHLMAKQCYFEGLRYRQENYPDWPLDSTIKGFQQKMKEGLSFDSTAAYIYLGLAMHHAFYSYRFDAAIENGKKAIELAPQCAAAYFIIGNIISNQHESPEAIPFLEKALTLDSSFLPSHLFLGLAFGFTGDQEKYFFHLNQYVTRVGALIENDPNNIPVFYLSQLGNALWKLGRIQEAEIILSESVEKSKGKAPNAWFNLMIVYAIEEDWEAATEAAEKWLNTSGSLYDVGGFLGFCYRQLGEVDKAERFYKNNIAKANTLNDSYSAAILLKSLGEHYLEQNRTKEAKEVFLRAYQMRPGEESVDGLFITIRALYVLEGEQAMLAAAASYMNQYPERSTAHHMLACAYAMAGESQKALEWLEKGIARDVNICWWALCDTDFVSLRKTEGYQVLCKKCFPNWGKE